MKLTAEKFEEIRDYTFRLMSEHHSPTALAFYGAYFDVEKDLILMLTPAFVAEIHNVDSKEFINKEKPFYNAAWNEFMSVPYNRPIESFFKEIGDFHAIGHTTYSATDIINILKRHEKYVLDGVARYVFVQGFLPEGCAPIKFKNVNGKPFFGLPNNPTEFTIDEDSVIPERYIEFDKSYACEVINKDSGYSLNVLELFGKTRSGLIISEKNWRPEYLEKANRLEGLYSDQMICSNILEIAEGEVMPPIHMTPIMLYDVLKIFMLCKNPIFNLVFQKEVNSHVRLESVPQDDDDLFIRVHFHVKDQSYGIQRG